MIKIKLKKGEKIDKALKRYRRKLNNVKTIQELRYRKQYKKPSLIKREKIQKAKYLESLKR